MQQKALEGSWSSWQESFENVNLSKPFRCPQCGEHTRFRSLTSLRAHLDYNHNYKKTPLMQNASLFASKITDLETSPALQINDILGSTRNLIKQKSSSAILCDLSCRNRKNRIPLEVVAENPTPFVTQLPVDSVINLKSGRSVTDTSASLEAHVKSKFNQMVETVDRTIEKRIDHLTKELSRKTDELLEVQAAFFQLSQKKQEVQRRERALNRQVDVAVELIAVLKLRLTESEQELLRKQEEVVTINHFLEAAAEKEVQGKARLQNFIENLLHRVDRAEKQLEYYRSQKDKLSYSAISEQAVYNKTIIYCFILPSLPMSQQVGYLNARIGGILSPLLIVQI
ncbi:protein ZNF365 isoform X2 [Microcaecilia unicolor]|uniref:Protein ZNF365 isoform X2 n=1 Tax=Microcaecilia unicolor TaxID=1415580 RepID=A0A6P7Y2C2_9AMPH|nr:protein ZNF365 isoform X2 [Microcaecilia unicolor]